jgi:hypothetical protein
MPIGVSLDVVVIESFSLWFDFAVQGLDVLGGLDVEGDGHRGADDEVAEPQRQLVVDAKLLAV